MEAYYLLINARTLVGLTHAAKHNAQGPSGARGFFLFDYSRGPADITINSYFWSFFNERVFFFTSDKRA